MQHEEGIDTNNFLIEFGARLKEERERKGMNQADFGALGEVGKLAQLHYEKGDRSPSAEYLNLICGYGVDVGYLMTGERGRPASEARETSVDCDLLADVLHELAKVADRKGIPLAAHETARLASLLYGRLAIRPDRNLRATVRDMAEIVVSMWTDFPARK